jgi:hypothetical protein
MHEKAMEHLQASYPDDREAAIFYALAVRGNASPSDDLREPEEPAQYLNGGISHRDTR